MSNPHINIVIGTLNRAPQKNYLGRTLDGLRASGLWQSRTPFRLDIVDSGSQDDQAYFQEEVFRHLPSPLGSQQFLLHLCEAEELRKPRPQFVSEKNGWVRRSRNANALECLRVGLKSGAPWILFLEDDVEVCNEFLDSVAQWLQDCGRRDRHLYSFCTPYRAICARRTQGFKTWDFPVKGFYGNQALAFTRSDAASALRYIEERLKTWDTGQGFDLLLKEWATATFRAEFFLSSVPSFAQHIGEESSLHLGRFHTSSGYAGNNWSYLRNEPQEAILP